MDYQRPDPDNGARVEDDFIRPLRHAKSISHRRLPAALPFAIAGILVVSSVAFGATVVRSLVASPSGTPVVVGDDDPSPDPTVEITLAPTAAPTEAPTVAPTEAPTVEPTQAPSEHSLTLTVTRDGNKAKLSWTRYQGDDFAYYKVVRSTDATASWPLGEGDKLVAAISNIDQLTFADCPPAGKTAYYQVFAVKSSESGYEVLADSNVVSVAMPAATPKPTASCAVTLHASVIAPTAGLGDVAVATVTSGSKVHLTWTKYRCYNFSYYGIQREDGTKVPTLGIGQQPSLWVDNVGGLATDDTEGLLPGHTYTYRLWVFSEKTGVTAGTADCNVGSILVISNIVRVTIPAV